MNKNEFIITVLSYMQDRTQFPFVEAEISNHIDDRTDFYLDAGYSFDEAEKKALERMGNAKELGIKMNLLHNCTTLNRATVVFLVLMVLTIVFYCYASCKDDWSNLAVIGNFAFYSVAFLLEAIIYILCTKTKNYKHSICGAITSIVFYALAHISNLIDREFDFLFSSVAYSYVGFIFVAGIINAIILFGLGANIKAIIESESKTDIISRYEAIKYIPLIEFIISFVCTAVLSISKFFGV